MFPFALHLGSGKLQKKLNSFVNSQFHFKQFTISATGEG
jgi:hypothetical protein